MKNSLIWLCLATLALSIGCGTTERDPLNGLTEIQGGKYQGGTFVYSESEFFKYLYPPAITEVVGSRLVTQTNEGLVTFDPATLEIKPCLAEDWEISPDGKTYTFFLRKGVMFHDDPCFEGGVGREMKAADVKYSLDNIFTHSVHRMINQASAQYKGFIVGGDSYFDSSKLDGFQRGAGVPGIKVVDDYTVSIQLLQPFGTLFLQKLALTQSVIYPQEWVDYYKEDISRTAVGTGPFMIEKLVDKELVLLKRNENYWAKDKDGNQLPYLSRVQIEFIGDQKTALLAFSEGDLDLQYRIPLEMRNDVLDENAALKGDYTGYQLQSKPSLTLQYYGFYHPGNLFQDVKIRRAFNYAIDRQAIVDNVLSGDGYPAFNGIVPIVMKEYTEYDPQVIRGYDYNPQEARKLFELAGYPNGEGFPAVELFINSGGKRNTQIAEALLKMLKENLNIDVSMKIMDWPQLTMMVENGEVDFWRLGWIADYPDPENFIQLFWSKHLENESTYMNSFRYRSAEFDRLFELALNTNNQVQKYLYYQQAEQIAMDDAAILPIYYALEHRLLQPYVQNFPQNAMEFRNFREVWFKK